jgi:DNA-binding response OmpR family regulator
VSESRALLRQNFAHSGCTAVLAESAEGAIVADREFRPDVAVIDLLLPGMDGATLIARLREEHQAVSSS